MMMVTTDMCQVEAVSTQVKFSKECDKQMVTVCQPQPSYGPSYHTVQHCKEVYKIGKTNKQTNKQTNKKTNKQTNKQTSKLSCNAIT